MLTLVFVLCLTPYWYLITLVLLLVLLTPVCTCLCCPSACSKKIMLSLAVWYRRWCVRGQFNQTWVKISVSFPVGANWTQCCPLWLHWKTRWIQVKSRATSMSLRSHMAWRELEHVDILQQIPTKRGQICALKRVATLLQILTKAKFWQQTDD